MELCLNSFDSTDRFDDGIMVDYAFMIRMWSAFDRSITRFNRECGLPKLRLSKQLDRKSGEEKSM